MEELADHISEFYSFSGKKLAPKLSHISKILRKRSVKEYIKPTTPIYFKRILSNTHQVVQPLKSQCVFRSVGREREGIEIKHIKSPCIGSYTPKFTLLESSTTFTFPKSIKPVCEPITIKKSSKRSSRIMSTVRNEMSQPTIDIDCDSRHLPNYIFTNQIGRRSVPNELNEKRFEYMPKITKSKCKIDFNKLTNRPELFKPPEFIHEYYLKSNYCSKRMRSKS